MDNEAQTLDGCELWDSAPDADEDELEGHNARARNRSAMSEVRGLQSRQAPPSAVTCLPCSR